MHDLTSGGPWYNLLTDSNSSGGVRAGRPTVETGHTSKAVIHPALGGLARHKILYLVAEALSLPILFPMQVYYLGKEMVSVRL